MKALAVRVGLYRVAALLIGCALVLEVLRNAVLPATRAASVVTTMGEILFLALAAAVFILARTRHPGR